MLEGVPRGAHCGNSLLGRSAFENDEHGCAELVGEVRVQPVVERGGGAREIGPFAEDEVEARFERLVAGDDPLAQLVVGGDRARLLLRQGP